MARVQTVLCLLSPGGRATESTKIIASSPRPISILVAPVFFSFLDPPSTPMPPPRFSFFLFSERRHIHASPFLLPHYSVNGLFLLLFFVRGVLGSSFCGRRGHLAAPRFASAASARRARSAAGFCIQVSSIMLNMSGVFVPPLDVSTIADDAC